MEGWIKLHRKLLENPICGKPEWAWVWIVILIKANHKTNKFLFNGKDIEIEKGSFITGRKQLAKETNVSEQTIRSVLKYLENNQQIIRKVTNKFSIITVCKYEEYQNIEKNLTNQQPTTNQPTTTNKNDKNDKNILINRDEPSVDNSSVKVDKPIKGISNMTESLQLALDKMKINKPARNVPDWMRHALEVSDKLKIDWSHPELIKENIKPRWFSLFKKKQWGDLQGAYSFCYDYPNKPDSAGMVKLFFWKSGHKDVNT